MVVVVAAQEPDQVLDALHAVRVHLVLEAVIDAEVGARGLDIGIGIYRSS